MFDPDLGRTGLEAPDAVRLLTGFVAADRANRVRLVLHDTTYVERRCPRLLRLFVRYGHCIEVRQSPEDLRHLGDCLLAADGRHAALRFHRDHARGKLLVDQPDDIAERLRRFDELWDLSSPALAATTLGL